MVRTFRCPGHWLDAKKQGLGWLPLLALPVLLGKGIGIRQVLMSENVIV